MRYREFWPKDEVQPISIHPSLLQKVCCKLSGGHSWVNLYHTYRGRKFQFCGKCFKFREEEKQFHQHCFNNEQEINDSLMCGCFYCLNVFEPYEIVEWTQGGNAICPNCSIDSVVGDSSGYPIMDKKFMRNMHDIWFENYFTPEGKLVVFGRIGKIKRWFRGIYPR